LTEKMPVMPNLGEGVPITIKMIGRPKAERPIVDDFIENQEIIFFYFCYIKAYLFYIF